jgi:hypothetical protein
MHFSILIPTRKRKEMLKTLLLSIYNTAIEKNQVETLVTYDNDDTITINALSELKEICKNYPVKFFSRERHYSINNSYYNEMAKKASGDYLIAVNDDTVFTKNVWDVSAYNKLETYLKDKPDRIVYGVTEDFEVEKSRNETNYFSCFPLLSKEVVKIMKFFFDPIYFKDTADWDLVMTYKELNRIINLRNEIEITHISYRSGRRERDLLDQDAMQLPEFHPSAGKNTKRNVAHLKEYILNYENIYKNNPEAIFNHFTRTWH